MIPATTTPSTPRQRARAAALTEMKDAALQQLSTSGAQSLSLRGVAREVGLVPSGIYRYFASRDELLTELIVDSYTDLADTLEGATDGGSPREEWRAVCASLRGFARDEPHRFLLIYGTPVTGYQAPERTIEPAARVIRALTDPVRGAGEPAAGAPSSTADPAFAAQLERMREALGDDFPGHALAPTIGAIAQLLGLLVLDLGGHFVGTFEPADALYADAVERLAGRLGLD